MNSIQKTPSLTPIITVSRVFLHQLGLWENTVRLSGIKRYKRRLLYEGHTEYGANMLSVNFNSLDLRSVKLRTIILLGSLQEWKNKDTRSDHIIPISLSGNCHQDEYVVLMMASNQEKHVSGDSKWSKEFVSGIKDLFQTTKTGRGTKNHISLGNYYGFGVTAKYDRLDDISYGEFSKKKIVNKDLHSEYCNILQRDLTMASDELNSILPHVVQCGKHITQALSNITQDLANPRAEINSFKEGMTSANVCENAQTLDSHTEVDCAYTMIISHLCAPGLNDKLMYMFEFEWNGKDQQILLQLTQ